MASISAASSGVTLGNLSKDDGDAKADGWKKWSLSLNFEII